MESFYYTHFSAHFRTRFETTSTTRLSLFQNRAAFISVDQLAQIFEKYFRKLISVRSTLNFRQIKYGTERELISRQQAHSYTSEQDTQ